MSRNRSIQVGIIGGGPAGITAAVQLARYRIPFLLFEKDALGGLLNCATTLKNIPGFPEGIDHVDFIERLNRHLDVYSIKSIKTEICSIQFRYPHFQLYSQTKIYKTSHLIIASGTVPKTHPKFHEKRELSTFLLYDTKKIRHLENKRIVIIGSGDAAFDYAGSLIPGNEVIILSRRKHIKCIPELVETVSRSHRIDLKINSLVEDILVKDDLLELTVKAGNTTFKIEGCHFLVCAIGRLPALNFIPSELNTRALSCSRLLFWAGDVKNGSLRQAAVAMGDGMKAAMMIAKQLESGKK